MTTGLGLRHDRPQARIRGVILLRRIHASWLEENHAGDVALADLAAHCGVSVRHLTRLFQTCYQTSPISYLVRLRVEHAAGLLVHSDRSITSIAMEVGFGDSNYLARQFRQVIGCTPRAYRCRAGIR